MQLILRQYLPADDYVFCSQLGTPYTTNSYGQAIRRACRLAGVKLWHSHQLRHERATEIRRLFGIETAQSVLGHADAATTLIYAERNLNAAIEAARKAG